MLGGDAMRRGERLKTWITVTILGLAMVVVILVTSACSCLPTVYQEVDLADVPAQVLENARRSAPNLIFHRAWKFAPGGRFKTEGGVTGYLLRSRVHWYESRDIKVYESVHDADPEDLQPIE
jgi:hypothetical protein